MDSCHGKWESGRIASVDRVIVEVGQFFEYTFHLLDQADEILMPLEDGFLAAIRRHVLREYCIAEKKEAVWDKISFCEVTFPKVKNVNEMKDYLLGGENDGQNKRKNS